MWKRKPIQASLASSGLVARIGIGGGGRTQSSGMRHGTRCILLNVLENSAYPASSYCQRLVCKHHATSLCHLIAGGATELLTRPARTFLAHWGCHSALCLDAPTSATLTCLDSLHASKHLHINAQPIETVSALLMISKDLNSFGGYLNHFSCSNVNSGLQCTPVFSIGVLQPLSIRFSLSVLIILPVLLQWPI